MSVLVSALADAALLLPAFALLLAYVAALREGRLVLALAASLVAVGAATVGLKLLLHACGHAITDARVASPSGHVSLATVFYGALAILLATGRTAGTKLLLGLGTALLLAAVGVARVRTGAHSLAEVGIGLGIGLGALALFVALHRWAGRPALSVVPVGVGFAAALLLIGGSHFSLEGRIIRAARGLSASLDVCAAPPEQRRRYLSERP